MIAHAVNGLDVGRTSISRIRSKIESDGGAPYIKTVYGMGYQWTGGEAK